MSGESLSRSLCVPLVGRCQESGWHLAHFPMSAEGTHPGKHPRERSPLHRKNAAVINVQHTLCNSRSCPPSNITVTAPKQNQKVSIPFLLGRCHLSSWSALEEPTSRAGVRRWRRHSVFCQKRSEKFTNFRIADFKLVKRIDGNTTSPRHGPANK